MATKFLEPGGDATFNTGTVPNGFWSVAVGTPAIATDFVHGSHIKSIKYRPGNADTLTTFNPSLTTAGSRVSLYIYLVALPYSTVPITSLADGINPAVDNNNVDISITSAGIIQLRSGASQIGTNGATLSIGQWYRISLAYTITSTVVNRFELFVNGVSSISITNATLLNSTTVSLWIGNVLTNANLDFRSSDHYIDNSAALTDPGNIWVTAKRPNANGTTNGFTTQIGAGGSGYGTGHSPQVNERPLSVTNGWSMVGAGSAVTEEYNIEGQGTGDITTVGGTIVDYTGWVSASAALSETGQIIVNNVTSNVSLTSTNTLFTKVAGSTTYPAGTGTDIGLITSTTVTTVSLYECGILVAFIPAAVVATTNQLAALGAG